MHCQQYSSPVSNTNINNLCNKVHTIAGFGNPLIDISATVEDEKFFEKFNLLPDGQKEVVMQEFDNILLTLKSENYEVSNGPGGCVQNTLRIIQAVVRQPSFCVFFGGVGNDKEGELLEVEVKKCGLSPRYAKHESYATGRSAALINGMNRSLVANLGAAKVYGMEDLKASDNLKILEEVFLVYVEGFFITHSFDVSMEVANICKSNGVIFTFNISGVYVSKTHPDELATIASYADILIGNSTEFAALAKVMNLGHADIGDLALQLYSKFSIKRPLSKFKLNQMNDYNKIFIITQGKDQVICVYGENKLVKYEVPYLEPKLVVDTTGAGDSFAAGFMVALFENKPINDCLASGCQIAQNVIQHIGVELIYKDA